MAVTATPVFPQTPKNGKFQLLPGTLTGVVYTGGANGSKIVGLIATSTDSSNRDVTISINRGGTAYVLGTVSVLATAGTLSSVPSINMFSGTQIPGIPIDSDNNPFLFLMDASDTLVATVAAVTAAKVINLVAIASDF